MRHGLGLVPALVDGLAIGKVWLLCEALKFLDGQWLENMHYESGSRQIRKILDARLAGSSSNQDEVTMIRDAEQHWEMWHLTPPSEFSETDQARSTDGDCEDPISSTVRNNQTRKFESYTSLKIAGTIRSERNNLDEELARGRSNVLSVSSSQPVTSKPSPLISEHQIHGSAPNVLKQPKTRQKRAASAPQTSEPNGFSAKNTDIGNPSGPPRHVETGTADVDETMITRPRFPNFQPREGQRPQSTTAIAREVFDVMKKPLSETKHLDKGCVYRLRMIDRPGYVKIGRTTQNIKKRTKKISACLGDGLEIINYDVDSCMVQNHTRIEALVHTELQSYRRYFKCPCSQKARGKIQDGEANDGMTQHGEWFEIDEEKACEVVRHWKDWMSTNPYNKGKLTYYEQAQIDRYANNQPLMETMVVKDENGREHWDWNRYLDSPYWYLRILWIHNFLLGEQIVKSRRSRWDSLKEHWLSNFVFVLVMSLMFRYLLFVASYFLPSDFSNTFVSFIMSCAFVSLAEILYFA
jgi:hypothetical protein